MSEVTELHEPLMAFLRSQGLLYRRSRPDQRTSEAKGEPDFLIMENGRVLALEMKQPKTGKLSKDQVFRHAEYHKAGCRVFVVRELSAAIELVEAWRTQAPNIYDEVKTGVRTLFGQQWRQKPGTTNELERNGSGGSAERTKPTDATKPIRTNQQNRSPMTEEDWIASKEPGEAGKILDGYKEPARDVESGESQSGANAEAQRRGEEAS